MKKLAFLLPLIFIGCGKNPSGSQSSVSNSEIPKRFVESRLRTELGEKLIPNEGAIVEKTKQIMIRFMEKNYKAGSKALRDFHAKSHGCVKANVKVLKGFPAEFRQGIFTPGKEYKAWIRFSNGREAANTPDLKSDVRGMAIKIMNVSGDRLLPEPATTQDFVLANQTAFFFKDAQMNFEALDAREKGGLALAAFALKNPKVAYKLAQTYQIDRVLNTVYHSMVPYRYGTLESAVKYAAFPCDRKPVVIPKTASDNYLREGLVEDLKNGNGCFYFAIQTPPYKDYRRFPVEEAWTEWDATRASFEPLAKIDIFKQEFNSDAQNQYCENLSFNPWQGIHDHQPLGSINRVRKVVYEAITKWRHEHNHAVRKEPTDWNF